MAERTITYRFQGDVSGLKSSLTSASTSVKNAGRELDLFTEKGEKMRAGLTTVGTAATRFGLVVAGGLALAGKAAMDWETAWAGVLKTVDGTPAQLSKLEGELRKLATTELPASHEEIAAVAQAAGQLGIQRDNVAGFTKTMIQLGETTNLSAEEAATAIARFTNVMGTAQSDVDRVGSSVVALGNNFATTEAEIVTLGQRMAAAGAIAGLSEADVLGFAAALSSVGVEAEAGGTAMSKVFTTMRDAVIDGGDNLETFAEVAGTSASEFAAKWEQAPAEAIASFIAGLGRMNAAGESTSKVFKSLDLNDQRLKRALLSTAEAGDVLTDAIGMSGEAWQENDALAEEFALRVGTTASQVKLAWNQVKDAAIDAGAVLLPILVQVAEAVSKFAEVWQDLPDGVQTAIVGIAAFAAMGGLVLGAAAKIVGGIANARRAFIDLGVSAQTADKTISRVFSGQGLMRAGLSVAGLAMATSGFAESSGLANTASYALMGTIAGPWGAAIGGGIGLLKDMAAANNDVEAAIRKADKAVSDGSSFEEMSSSVANARKELDEYRKGFEDMTSGKYWKNTLTGVGAKNTIEGIFGKSDVEEAKERFNEVANAAFYAEKNAKALAIALGATHEVTKNKNWVSEWLGEGPEYITETTVAVEDMDAAVRSAAPAMESLGIDKAFSDLNDEELRKVAEEIKRLDSESGRVDTLADAFAGLDTETTSTAESAKALKDALDQLLGPAMGQEKALLAWKQSLASLNDDLAENSRSLSRNTAAGRQNRGAILDRISALKDTIVADADAEATSEQLARKMRNGRKDILDSAQAAGLNRDRVREMIHQMGLTPKNIRTLIEAVGVDSAKFKVSEFKAFLDSVPRTINTVISATMMPINPIAAALRMARGADGMTVPRFADGGSSPGGTVAGQREPYGDKVLAYLAPGEEVISNRFGQADRHRDLLKAINANSFADGGTIQSFANGGTAGGGITSFARQLGYLSMSLKALRKELERSRKAVDNAKQRRDDVKATRDALAEAIKSSYRTDLFAAPSNIWAQGASMSPLSTLQSDIADIRALNKARAQLANKGVRGGALDTLLQQGSLADVQAMAGWSKADLKAYSALYSQREALLSRAGTAAGQSAYAAELKQANRELRGLRQENKQLRRAVNRVEKATKNAGKNAKAGRRGESARAGRNRR